MTRLLQSLEDLKIKETDLEYLKVKEVASQLRAEGYSVTESPSGIDEGFAILATKGDKKLAVEVKTSSRLQASAETIKNLRKRALEQGFDEFRLILVSPPHERTVKIANLENQLENQLKNQLGSELVKKLQQPGQIPEKDYEEWNFENIQGVVETDVNSVEITPDGIHVTGTAIVKVSSCPFFWQRVDEPHQIIVDSWNLPFNFDVKLSHDLEISVVYKLEIDTSSLEEE